MPTLSVLRDFHVHLGCPYKHTVKKSFPLTVTTSISIVVLLSQIVLTPCVWIKFAYANHVTLPTPWHVRCASINQRQLLNETLRFEPCRNQFCLRLQTMHIATQILFVAGERYRLSANPSLPSTIANDSTISFSWKKESKLFQRWVPYQQPR